MFLFTSDQETPFTVTSNLPIVNEEADLATRMNVRIPLFQVSDESTKGNAYENVMQQRSFKQHNKIVNTISAPGNYVNIHAAPRKYIVLKNILVNHCQRSAVLTYAGVYSLA